MSESHPHFMADRETGWLWLTGHPDGMHVEALWSAEDPGDGAVRIPNSSDYNNLDTVAPRRTPRTLGVKRLGRGIVTHALAMHMTSGPLYRHTYCIDLTFLLGDERFRVCLHTDGTDDGTDEPVFEPVVVPGERLESFNGEEDE